MVNGRSGASHKLFGVTGGPESPSVLYVATAVFAAVEEWTLATPYSVSTAAATVVAVVVASTASA